MVNGSSILRKINNIIVQISKYLIKNFEKCSIKVILLNPVEIVGKKINLVERVKISINNMVSKLRVNQLTIAKMTVK